MQVIEILGEAGPPETLTPGDVVTKITETIRHSAATNEALPAMTAKGALITCEANTVHVTFDGTAPTALAGTNIGHALYDGDSYVIRGQNNVRNFQCIDRVSGAAGIIKVTPFF